MSIPAFILLVVCGLAIFSGRGDNGRSRSSEGRPAKRKTRRRDEPYIKDDDEIDIKDFVE